MCDSNVGDIHGFFQFADASDDDDGLFAKTRDRKPDFDLEKINYTPQIDQDGWYDRSDTVRIDEWLQQPHTGLDEVHFTVQRLYFTRQYHKALDIVRQLVVSFTSRRNPRIASIRENLEIGAHSAIHLGDLDSLQYFYDWYQKCGGCNPGYSMFQAKVLTALGKPDRALGQHIEYLEQRPQDALVWEHIARLLVQLGASDMGEWQRVALAALVRSHSIITQCRNWQTTEVAVRRKNVQTRHIDSLAADILAHLGKAQCDGLWAVCLAESILDAPAQQRLLASVTTNSYLKQKLEWIFAKLYKPSSSQQDTDEDDYEKHVSEL